MKVSEVTIARIYLQEGHDKVNSVLDILHGEENILGATVIRGIAGFGMDREIHTSSLLTLSIDLPLIIEFYDLPEKVEKAVQVLKARLDLEHIVCWQGTAFS